ncbi:MAG: hypothetical protein QMD95_03490 [Candidatus Hodarchaeaceae archaeon]|nr:hypothetical protein [Candidatus Hodarchaeaceae archaeon]
MRFQPQDTSAEQALPLHARGALGLRPPRRRAVKLFEGTHDFRHFYKHERVKSTIGELKYAGVRGQKVLVFDFIAPTFLWQQVRRMAVVVLAVGTSGLGLITLSAKFSSSFISRE